MRVIRIKNFRRGLATNSSSTHSIIYKNNDDMFKDLNVFELNFYDRCTETIAATKEAKIKYVLADIWRYEDLVELLAERYPEMQQYYELIKEQHRIDNLSWEDRKGISYEDEYIFGTHNRGWFADYNNILFAYEYLCHVIETEDLVIVGGSDELDFVYDTTKDHTFAPMQDTVYFPHFDKNKTKAIKNGNYWVAYGTLYDDEKYKYCSGNKLRFMIDDGDPVPEVPELIDLRITNKCDHNCSFCFMDSNMREKEANINELKYFINKLNKRTEFSIGGGNILMYSHLEELLERLNKKGHIVNTTINVKDCDKVIKDKDIHDMFEKYVDGIGVSIFKPEDIDKVDELIDSFNEDNSFYGRKYITIHIVPEYLGFKTTMEIMKKQSKHWHPILFLGYKENGRGKNCKHTKFTKNQIKQLFSGSRTISIDTSFANTYKNYLDEMFSTNYTLTMNEGEYSMYVDGITMNAYKSSYQTDKPYYVGDEVDVDWKDKKFIGLTVEEAFANIRKDGGFEAYDNKHYWNN